MNDLWTFLKSEDGKVAITLVGIFLSACLAVTFFLLNRKSKKLIYQIISRTRVLAVREELASKVQILFEGQRVREVGIFEIRITNSGREPVRASDFVRPITFIPLEGTRIIDAGIVKVEPDTFDASLRRDGDRVILAPTLFNVRDSVQIRLLIENFDGRFYIDSRIDGTELEPGRKKGPLEQSLVESLMLVAYLAVTVAILHGGLAKTVALLFIGLAFGAIVFKVSRSFRYSAEAPNDYR